jgi:undecaprenyl-diphosphatase
VNADPHPNADPQVNADPRVSAVPHPNADPRARAPRTELTFVAALVALVAFVYLGVTVSLAAPGAFDAGVRATLMSLLDHDPALTALDVLNAVGGLEGGAILTIGLAGLLLGLRRPAAAAAIASTWLAEGVSSIAKELLQRPRPPGAIVQSALNESWSYPSGHVVRAMAVVAVVLWLATSRRSWNERTALALAGGLVAGVVMGIARIATGAHWPTDVLGGLILGTVYVLLFAITWDAVVSRRGPARERRPPPTPGPGSA